MRLHDWVEGAIGFAVTMVFVFSLGLIARDAYVYLYTGSVDWLTGDQIINQLVGSVCAEGGLRVVLCDALARIHAGIVLVIVGPLCITLLGAGTLGLRGLGLRLVVAVRDGLVLPGGWHPAGGRTSSVTFNREGR